MLIGIGGWLTVSWVCFVGRFSKGGDIGIKGDKRLRLILLGTFCAIWNERNRRLFRG